MNQPIVFLRIAWMSNYQGVTLKDIPKGAGSYVTINEDGGEVYNFTKNNGYYYGYARIQMGRNINLTNLGAPKHATELNGVTVVFFARNPVYGSQYIIGWYKNATLYQNLHEIPVKGRGEWGHYLAKCKIKDGNLLPLEERNYEVEGPGQTNLWYPNNYLSETELKGLYKYLDDPEELKNKRATKKVGRGWQLDAELRKQIEIAAMDATADYFEAKGFKIYDVHKNNHGWDLEAVKGSKKFHIEVKGTQNSFICVELTPNEYKQLKNYSGTYRICIVSNALNKKLQKVDVFYNDSGRWTNERKEEIKINVVESARITFK